MVLYNYLWKYYDSVKARMKAQTPNKEVLNEMVTTA
jgi:hypothetical protein